MIPFTSSLISERKTNHVYPDYLGHSYRLQPIIRFLIDTLNNLGIHNSDYLQMN